MTNLGEHALMRKGEPKKPAKGGDPPWTQTMNAEIKSLAPVGSPADLFIPLTVDGAAGFEPATTGVRRAHETGAFASFELPAPMR
jgi:hypothetical protein